MLLFEWASEVSPLGICAATTPSLFIIFARRDFSLKCMLPGVIVTIV